MGRMVYEFQDTQRSLIESEKLYRLTSKAVLCTALYPEKMSITRTMESCYTDISVAEMTTLQAAVRMAEQYPKVAVLNFANAVSPGGGTAYGEDSQEASLCRNTNLYPCLIKSEHLVHFYQYNDEKAPYYSSRIIYSENVAVIKNEEGKPRKNYIPIDVITCCAPNVRDLRATMREKRLEKLLKERMRNILTTAELHGVQALVLGAFGCGALGNSPEMIASAFRELLVEGEFAHSFRAVVFAVAVKKNSDRRNLEIFRSTFGSTPEAPLWGKKVSIYGDSISTYEGYHPASCKVYYDRERAGRAGIFSVDSTWWMIVLRHFGAQILCNNSWSGSKVYGNSMSSGNSDWRTKNLHKNGELPDAILVYMGVNDFGNGVFTGEGYFRSAYAEMLWNLKCRYPKAEIYCATISTGMINGENMFPEVLYGNALQDYNRDIRICARKYGVHLIDLAAMGVSYESVDGCHPNALGMQQLADGWIRGITGKIPEKRQKKTEKRELWIRILLGIEGIILIVLIVLLIWSL